MLLNREPPLSEPRAQRFDHALTLERMLMEYLPLLGRRCSRFIQDLDVDGDLPYVVQQGRPAQSIAIRLRQPQFVGDEIGVRANALRVTTSASIVRTEGGDHGKYLRGRLHRLSMTGVVETVHVAVKLAR
jgi:hypothetical protein